MTREEARQILHKLRRRYLMQRWTETMLLAGAVALLTGTLANGEVTGVLWMAMGGVFLITGLVVARHLKLFTTSERALTAYLNQQYPAFKESADLLVRSPEDLTLLQEIQQAQSIRILKQISPAIRFPHRIPLAALSFLLAGIVLFAVSLVPHPQQENRVVSSTDELVSAGGADTIPSRIAASSVLITPPAYTRQTAHAGQPTRVVFPEGSTLSWSLQFSKAIQRAAIILDGRDTGNLIQTNQGFTHQTKRVGSGYYQFQWYDATGSHASDFYELKSIEDRAPTLSIDNLPQFTQLSVNDSKTIELRATLSDDYGMAQADVVATVSKGSGESVKFREEHMSFHTPADIRGRVIHAGLTFDLVKMGLEPGDELYFYVQGLDNKPEPNYSRTETFFIALRDTAQQAVTADAGLGVDLMPEYFRSQRQIIIDTEKLLRDRKTITRQAFNSTSNELGYDQKVLRLRYGQFLGEEAEAGIGVEAEEHADDEDPVKKYGHTHDKDNEHNLVENRKGQEHDEHADPNAKEDPMKAFMHTHDSEEEATFFIQSVKAKLKAALTLMWDAELQLRLYEPAKSLPYQYKILNLLKEISNDSRIYVHRTGFDPPPLKEEKRLTGDLAEIRDAINPFLPPAKNSLPAIEEALHATEQMLAQKDSTITANVHDIYRKAGIEAAALALQQPGRHLSLLSLLKRLSEAPAASGFDLVTLRKNIWLALPATTDTPGAGVTQQHQLNQRLLNTLDHLHE
jgi:hypothetical protein